VLVDALVHHCCDRPFNCLLIGFHHVSAILNHRPELVETLIYCCGMLSSDRSAFDLVEDIRDVLHGDCPEMQTGGGGGGGGGDVRVVLGGLCSSVTRTLSSGSGLAMSSELRFFVPN